MLLLALVLALNVSFDATQTQEYKIQRAYVAQAMSRLNHGCLTCHESVNANFSNERDYALVGQFDHNLKYQSTISNELASISPQLQYQLNTQLIETGQRILNLPDMPDQHAETVIEDYLRVYAQASAAPNEQTALWALWQLDDIDTLLRVLENQASPYQLSRQENQPTQCNSAALHTLTVAPSVAVMTRHVATSAVIQDMGTRPESAALAMPFEVAYAIHRRGPPAGVYLDSVL